MELQRFEDRATRACNNTVDALLRAGVPAEALAEFFPEGRRFLVLPRPATMRAIGEAWRLGTLLLDTTGGLWAAGRATRATERGRPGYQSDSREERRDLAAAALRGGYPAGTSVNFDARPLSLDEASVRAQSEHSPIAWNEGEIRVRWRAGATLEGAPTLAHYLSERAELLINPPLASD